MLWSLYIIILTHSYIKSLFIYFYACLFWSLSGLLLFLTNFNEAKKEIMFLWNINFVRQSLLCFLFLVCMCIIEHCRIVLTMLLKWRWFFCFFLSFCHLAIVWHKKKAFSIFRMLNGWEMSWCYNKKVDSIVVIVINGPFFLFNLIFLKYVMWIK